MGGIIKANYIDSKSGSVEFDNFSIKKRSDNYFVVLDEFGDEITSGKSLLDAAKKAKLLQIGYNLAIDRYTSGGINYGKKI